MSARRVAAYFLVYMYGLVAGAVGGGISALGSIPLGSMMGAPDFTPRQLWVIFIGAAITSGAAYLKQSPHPRLIVRPDGEIDVETHPGTGNREVH